MAKLTNAEIEELALARMFERNDTISSGKKAKYGWTYAHASTLAERVFILENGRRPYTWKEIAFVELFPHCERVLETLMRKHKFIKYNPSKCGYYIDMATLYSMYLNAAVPNQQPDYIELLEAAGIA